MGQRRFQEPSNRPPDHVYMRGSPSPDVLRLTCVGLGMFSADTMSGVDVRAEAWIGHFDLTASHPERRASLTCLTLLGALIGWFQRTLAAAAGRMVFRACFCLEASRATRRQTLLHSCVQLHDLSVAIGERMRLDWREGALVSENLGTTAPRLPLLQNLPWQRVFSNHFKRRHAHKLVRRGRTGKSCEMISPGSARPTACR